MNPQSSPFAQERPLHSGGQLAPGEIGVQKQVHIPKVVVVVVAQGLGEQVPAPKLLGWFASHVASTTHWPSKAPPGDPQHWTCACVVVVVVVLVGHVPQSCGHLEQSSEGPHSPSPHTQLQGGDPPVQLQRPALQSAMTCLTQAPLACPLSPLAATSSVQAL